MATTIIYDVELTPQPNKYSCWAASMAMLVSFKQQVSISPEDLAASVGRSLNTSYGWDMLEEVRDHYRIRDIPLPSNASLCPPPKQWVDWLTNRGPLWVTTTGAPSHAIVVRGIASDLTPEGTTMYVNNPWDIWTNFSNDPVDFNPPNKGSAYTRLFSDFAADFGLMDLADYGKWRVLYIVS